MNNAKTDFFMIDPLSIKYSSYRDGSIRWLSKYATPTKLIENFSIGIELLDIPDIISEAEVDDFSELYLWM